MLSVQDTFDAFRSNGVTFFAGVPDSLLKDICAYITDSTEPDRHIIAANEGAAVALAAGHYLATRELGLVYFQNSGLGNTINPLLSLADAEVYSIPMLLLIGWRGEPGVHDEPQHVKQGRVMLAMLDAMEIGYEILSTEQAVANEQIRVAAEAAVRGQRPFAIVVRKGTFEPYKLRSERKTNFPLVREDAIRLVLDSVPDDAVIVSTTGMTSREVFEHRAARGQGHHRDFLTVGSMGHASQIALGIAMRRPERQVYCLDGDGAVLMHMGSVVLQGTRAPANYRHILLNNGAHDSVGGQPTAGFDVDFIAISRACGYRSAERAESPQEIAEALRRMSEVPGPTLLEIRVNKGARPDLGRPTRTPIQNRDEFMQWLIRS